MSSVLIEDVTYGNGGKVILRNLSATFASGAITSILGPTGSGKTTLLRLIAGLDVPHSGRILIDGKVVSTPKKILVPPHQRNLGFVFQDLALWPHFTVYKNIAFGLEERKDRMVKDKVTQILEEFGIGDQAKKFPHELSGGQKQLVAIARSLVLNPSILMLDEPVSNLDVKLEVKIIEHLKKIQAEKKLTMLWVMHNHRVAIDHSHFIVIINEGKVEGQGTGENILRTDSTFINQFINY
jgi:ABC-type Fe3+/spermidine/putrescine transport system ATPase subunit